MIDWRHIKQLEADVGAGEFKNVVTLFLDEVDSEIELLKGPLAADPATLGPRMHFLKGSAYYLGFRDFGDLCSQNETLAKTGRVAEVDLAKLIRIYQASKDRFLADVRNYCSFSAVA